ncbi:unnamed protein product [Schistosoma turkestanicum]|nr:unnamed protein product [Schistosoma turkestanicum]
MGSWQRWALLFTLSAVLALFIANTIFLCLISPYSLEFYVKNSTGKASVHVQNVPTGNKWLNFLYNKTHVNSQHDVSIKDVCSMDNCFDYTLCQSEFKVYVYPPSSKQTNPSLTYQKILTALHNSKLLTSDPYEACIFIPSLDTLDRDPLSPHFGQYIAQELVNLPFWNSLPRRDPDTNSIPTSNQQLSKYGGRNHLIFNLHAGTWPYYHEDEYRLWLGQAMLAKASFSTKHFRPKFDISLPLIHSQHPLKSGSIQLDHLVSSEHLRGRLDLPYLLSFKGKRYVSGIGSASRDILFHLHNGKDIIMLTTCRHGTDWIRYADKRCATDMALYDTYDYWELMHNSTFCLVPRGRRLGSYRFLEVLQAGCIPVMLSNDLELPFSEVIDWNRAVIWADERLPLLLPLSLRRITSHQIIQYRQQVMFLWHTYLSSIESIVLTTLEILRDRVSLRRRSYEIWNTLPGGLVVSHVNSMDSCDVAIQRYPTHCQYEIKSGFTMLIPIRTELCAVYMERLKSLGGILFHSVYLRKIIIVWQCKNFPPNNNELKSYASVPVEIVLPDERFTSKYFPNSISPAVRFQPFHEIPTLAVFTYSLDLNITVEELNFAYLTWQEFPNRLVGFQARSHYWNATDHLWKYDDNPSMKHFSIVLLNGAFYHRYYHHLYLTLLDRKLHEIVNVFNNCEDILFNCLISHVTSLPPIKLFNTSYIEQKLLSIDKKHLNFTELNIYREQRTLCIQAFSQHFIKFPYTGKQSNPLINDQYISEENTPELYLPLYISSYSIHPSM